MVKMCVCIILVFVNKQAFWRWRFPNMGIEGVELSKTDKRQKSYNYYYNRHIQNNDIFTIWIVNKYMLILLSQNEQGISALDLQKHIFPSRSSLMKSTYPWMQRHFVNYYKGE